MLNLARAVFRLSGKRLNNTCLLMLGMHRSGTAASMGCFNLCGVYIGKKLIPAGSDNPRGFYEHRKISNLHDDLLDAFGTSWDDPRPLPENFHTDPRAIPFRNRLRDILLRDFAGRPLWGVKDPRICRLLPLWLPLLEELNVTVKVLHVVRHPAEVAASLASRSAMSESQALALWLHHLILAELRTRNLIRSVILYEDLIADWRGEVGRVEEELGLPLPEITQKVRALVSGFLSSDLRHHNSCELETSGPFNNLAHAAFNAIRAWRRENIEPGPALDEVSGTLRDALIIDQQEYSLRRLEGASAQSS
jgi:hypothetical protein